VTEQARNGQQQATDGLRSLARELHEMADSGQQHGPASDLAKQAADKLGDLAEWLGRREPGDLVQEVRALARRRPGAFLLGAAAAGVLAGRLTRGAVDANRDTGRRDVTGWDTPSSPASAVTYPPAPMEPAGYPPVPPQSGYPAAPPPAGVAGEPGWLPPEPEYPQHGSPVPSPGYYPENDPAAARPSDLGSAGAPTPPSGTRTVGEYVDDLRDEGRPEAGGPR
jgi:hypothetical protein